MKSLEFSRIVSVLLGFFTVESQLLAEWDVQLLEGIKLAQQTLIVRSRGIAAFVITGQVSQRWDQLCDELWGGRDFSQIVSTDPFLFQRLKCLVQNRLHVHDELLRLLMLKKVHSPTRALCWPRFTHRI
nr:MULTISPECIES: hypothetical protein [Providencia]